MPNANAVAAPAARFRVTMMSAEASANDRLACSSRSPRTSPTCHARTRGEGNETAESLATSATSGAASESVAGDSVAGEPGSSAAGPGCAAYPGDAATSRTSARAHTGSAAC
jgi:hypothetical protein